MPQKYLLKLFRSLRLRKPAHGVPGVVLFMFCLSFLVCPVLAVADPGPAPERMLEDLEQQRRQQAALMEAATVFVIAEKQGGADIGSGFIIADGYVMTNAHVVEEALSGTGEIYIINGVLPLTKAMVVDVDYHELPESDKSISDFALLSFIPPKGVDLPILSFNTDVRRMDRVSAWGYPAMIVEMDDRMSALFSGEGSEAPPVVYTEGTISTLVKDNNNNIIIHTAPITGGNSGGPLVNRRGEVVGINTWNRQSEDKRGIVSMSIESKDILSFLERSGIDPLVASSSDLAMNQATHENKPFPQPPVTPEPTEQGEMDPRVTDSEAREILANALDGDPNSMSYVGFCYVDGIEGFPEDFDSARHWLELAAEAGVADAQGMLGIFCIYYDDRRDPQKGLEYLLQSAESDEADAAFRALLADVLYEGEHLGIEADYEASFAWAEKAAEEGSYLGKAVLGFHYYDGLVVEEDLDKAFELGQEAADAGEARGKSLLAVINYARSTESELDEETFQLASDAADAGDRFAQGLLAYFYAVEKDDYVAAERMARLAAGQADPMGSYVLGWLYYKGLVVDKNLPLAWAYITIGSDTIKDPGFEDGELLPLLEKEMSDEEKEDGDSLRKMMRAEWGLS